MCSKVPIQLNNTFESQNYKTRWVFKISISLSLIVDNLATFLYLLQPKQIAFHLPNRLWSFLVPCTVPSGSISRWNPVLQYSCLLLRIPLRCVRSAVVLRESLSPGMRCSPSSVGLSPKGVSRKWDPTCATPSMPCKTPPTSPRVAAAAAAAAAAIASKLSG